MLKKHCCDDIPVHVIQQLFMITRIFFISETSFSPIIFTFHPPFVTINHKAKAYPKTFRKKGEGYEIFIFPFLH